ncbi:lipoprotein [Pseudomonas fluorescens]|uniref:lipoprotein n=1 Tax=Pseudomonas fluorescens TaxID=294 RepID=UPI0006424EAF|nr:lipoprotein [Pseudomonas fluorescens]
MKLCYLLLVLLLAGCDHTQDKAPNKTRSSVARLHIPLGTPVAEFLEKSPVSFTADCLDAVNLCWYEADRQGALLDLSLAQPEGTLELDQVAGLLIAVDGNTSNTIQAWLSNNMFYDWYLYHGNYIAHVRALRYDSKSAPLQSAVYLISLNLMSLDTFWTRDFAEAQRAQWRTLFPAHLKERLQRRSEVESRARAAGVDIEESYSPPLMERGQ